MAEKRKNDPVLNQSQDHLVRKLFSKFKKGGPVPPPAPLAIAAPTVGATTTPSPESCVVRDIEKGETGLAATKPTKDEANTAEIAPKPPQRPSIGGWGRLRGDRPSPVTPKPAETAPAADKPVLTAALPAPTTVAGAPTAGDEHPKVAAGNSNADYVAINDRLSRIEQLISDFMVKVDDKTRSIEKSVAKSKSKSSKKTHSVTISVDSPRSRGAGAGLSSNTNNCDEQFL